MKKDANNAALFVAIFLLLSVTGCLLESSDENTGKRTIVNKVIEIPVGVAK